MLEHGGQLRDAAVKYHIPLSNWLDLSTGINPNGWQVDELPASTWVRLPEENDGLLKIAKEYYLTENLLAVAGTQAAIQVLPRLLHPSRVSVIHPAYTEHAYAWQRNGHAVTLIAANKVDKALHQTDVLILINPNNPTGKQFPQEKLLYWASQLDSRGGWLVVDEAFIDVTPERSIAHFCPRPGLVVLRSLGKFFGLAGARVGFVISTGKILIQMKERIGPWSVSGPARWVAREALKDIQWQQKTRQQLTANAERLKSLLISHGLTPDGGCAFFQWVCTPHALQIHEDLARRGILVRYFSEPSSLRFGLPGNDLDWNRLNVALSELSEKYQLKECIA